MTAKNAFDIMFKLIRSICNNCGANFNGSKNTWACCACPLYVVKKTLELCFKQKLPLYKARALAELEINRETAKLTQQIRLSFKKKMQQSIEQYWKELGFENKNINQQLKKFYDEWKYMEEIPHDKSKEFTEIAQANK